jgi:hypothetical protein
MTCLIATEANDTIKIVSTAITGTVVAASSLTTTTNIPFSRSAVVSTASCIGISSSSSVVDGTITITSAVTIAIAITITIASIIISLSCPRLDLVQLRNRHAKICFESLVAKYACHIFPSKAWGD